MTQHEAMDEYCQAVSDAISGSARVKAAARQLRAVGLAFDSSTLDISVRHIEPEPLPTRFALLRGFWRKFWRELRSRRPDLFTRTKLNHADAAFLKCMNIVPDIEARK